MPNPCAEAQLEAQVPHPARTWELSIGAGALPNRRIESGGWLGARLGWFPADRVALTIGVGTGLPASPGTTQIVGQQLQPVGSIASGTRGEGSALVELAPVTGELVVAGRTWALRGFAVVGVGFLQTLDDPFDVLDRYGDDAFDATRFQTHPTLEWGGAVRIEPPVGPLGLQLRVDQARWVEVYEESTTENRQRVVVQAGGSVRW